MTSILNKVQAAAVYSAMINLNNVSGAINVLLRNPDGSHIRVFEKASNKVIVTLEDAEGDLVNAEEYADQTLFAEAYGVA